MRLAETNKKTDVDRDVKQGLSSEAPPNIKKSGRREGTSKDNGEETFFFF